MKKLARGNRKGGLKSVQTNSDSSEKFFKGAMRTLKITLERESEGYGGVYSVLATKLGFLGPNKTREKRTGGKQAVGQVIYWGVGKRPEGVPGEKQQGRCHSVSWLTRVGEGAEGSEGG